MKKTEINKDNLRQRVAVVVALQTIAFAVQVAGLILLFTNGWILGISLMIPIAFIEFIYGIWIMVLSAYSEKNTGYLSTAGYIYMCPFCQPGGIYFQVRYFIDRVKQKSINKRRAAALKKKED